MPTTRKKNASNPDAGGVYVTVIEIESIDAVRERDGLSFSQSIATPKPVAFISATVNVVPHKSEPPPNVVVASEVPQVVLSNLAVPVRVFAVLVMLTPAPALVLAKVIDVAALACRTMSTWIPRIVEPPGMLNP